MAEKKTTKPTDGAAVLEKIAAWDAPYREIGERVHALVLEAAPELKPKLWYGMPGYAKTKSGPVLIFFRVDDVMSFGITEKANISVEDGAENQLVPSAWFLRELDEPTEARIAAIVRRAAE